MSRQERPGISDNYSSLVSSSGVIIVSTESYLYPQSLRVDDDVIY